METPAVPAPSDARPWFVQELQKQTELVRETTVARAARYVAEKWEERMMYVELLLLLFVILSFFIWWTLMRQRIKTQYKDMIEWIDEQIKQGYYQGKGTGMQFAFWYHYPHLSIVQMVNINLPAAVVYAFYGSPNGSISADFKSSTDSLQSLFDYSELHDRATAIQILCYWVNTKSQDKESSFCTQFCGIPPVYTGAEAATTITNTSFAYAMTFEVVGGPIGAVIGLGVGAAMGSWQSKENAAWYKQECDWSQQNQCQSPSSITCGTVVQ